MLANLPFNSSVIMKIHKIPAYISILYLVEYDHGLLLLDGGCRPDLMVVKKFIEEELKRPFSDLKLVCVSHAHPDHSGGASFYQEYGIKVAGTSQCNQWYGGFQGWLAYWVDLFLTYYVASKVRKEEVYQNVIFPRRVKFDFDIVPGQVLPLFSEWKILSTPGHTDNDISFFHEGSQTAYVADNIIALHNRFIPPYPITKPKEYRKSLSLYKQLGVKEFLMAHYGAHRVPEEALNQIIEKVSDKPRRHRTTIPRLFFKLFRKK